MARRFFAKLVPPTLVGLLAFGCGATTPNPSTPRGDSGASLLDEAATLLGRHDDNLPRGEEFAARRERAFALITEAESLAPESADVHALWGRYWFVMWHPAKSFACYQKALALDKNHGEASLGFGELLLRLATASGGTAGQLHHATIHLETAQYLGIDDWSVAPLLALAYRLGGQHEKALDAALAAARVRGDSWKVHNVLGLAYRNAGEPEKAETSHRQALRLLDAELAAHSAAQSAGTQKSRALLLSSRGVVLYNLALAAADMGLRDDALATLREARDAQTDLLELEERASQSEDTNQRAGSARHWIQWIDAATQAVESARPVDAGVGGRI